MVEQPTPHSTLAAIGNAYARNQSASTNIQSIANYSCSQQGLVEQQWHPHIRTIQQTGTLENKTIDQIINLLRDTDTSYETVSKLLLGYTGVAATQLNDQPPIRQPVNEGLLQDTIDHVYQRNSDAVRSNLRSIAARASESTLLSRSTSQQISENKIKYQPDSTLSSACQINKRDCNLNYTLSRSNTNFNWTLDQLCDYSPEAFEHLVGELFSVLGYETVVSQYVHDNGIDVIATAPGGHGALIQVKRYAPSNQVSIGAVQRLRGTVAELNAPRGLVVTTSGFTDPAIKSARRMDCLHLLSGERLVDLLNTSPIVPSPPTAQR